MKSEKGEVRDDSHILGQEIERIELPFIKKVKTVGVA